MQVLISELSVLGGWPGGPPLHFMVGSGRGPTKIGKKMKISMDLEVLIALGTCFCCCCDVEVGVRPIFVFF